MMRSARLVIAIGLVALVAVACGSEDESEPGAATSQTVSVEAFDFYFEPTDLTVDTSTEVTIEFTNSGSVEHSWTSTDLDAEVEASSGEDATLTFTTPAEAGSYDFFCEYHPDEMQGTISIGGSDEPAEEQPEDAEDEDVDVDVDTEEENSNEGAGY